MRQSITQKNAMGCGAACVAFVAGKTYDEVVEVLGADKARTAGYRLKELVEGLSHFGITARHKHVKEGANANAYKAGAIVFIKRSIKYPDGHYLARHGNAWMDPRINCLFENDIANAQSGYRKRLPGKVQWVIHVDS